MSLLPSDVGGRLRGRLLRLAGCDLHPNVIFSSKPRLLGEGNIAPRLHAGQGVVVNDRVTFELGADITLGPYVGLGPDVMILTTSHIIAEGEHRWGDSVLRPVEIHEGAWIGARAIVLPGVTVGASSVVGANSVVTKDVPPNVVVGGVPAKVIRVLEPGEDATATPPTAG